MKRLVSLHSLRAALLAVSILYLGATCQLHAQAADTLYFDQVAVYYPGQPEVGGIKADLRWFTATGGLMGLDIVFRWTGAAVCDSFVFDPTLAAFFEDSGAPIHNEQSLIYVSHYDGQSPHVAYPADYKYGELYFTVLDTGLVSITGGVVLATVPGIPVFGYCVPSAFYICNSGDINNDGTSGNIADVVALLGYIFGSIPAQPRPFADVNGDCTINITDAVCLVGYILAQGAEPMPGCEF